MVFLRWTTLRRYLLLSAMLALLLFISSIWLRAEPGRSLGRGRTCNSWEHSEPPLVAAQQEELDGAPPLIRECPGQSFQVSHLLQFLNSCISAADDVLLEPYLQSWDQLISFMESLGTMVSFFSQKLREKVALIRELSLKQQGRQTPVAAFGLKNGVYRSARTMVEAELRLGVVSFTRQTDSGSRTLLRLHRSLLWLKLLLEGLTEGPDAAGRLKPPGELSRDAYWVALAPHHPWMLRQAAELVFLALPDRKYFWQLVCVQSQEEAVPVLHVIIQALARVHARTQRILEEHAMLELP
ncbi:ceramide-1-phosphate transfer protein [Aulostomus maculatus]